MARESLDPIRKSYVDTAYGQVHVRVAGPDDGRPLVLVHWTPASGRMWSAAALLFASAGRHVIMPDLLGYGRSDPRPQDWSMSQWADSILQLVTGLGIEGFDLVGGHNGASVAAEIAIAAPERVSRLVLDGCAILTPELRVAFAKLAASDRPKPDQPGVERLAWDRALGVLKEYRPGFVLNDRTIEQVWPLMLDYLETDFVSSALVGSKYDLAERLPMIKAPLLIMAATTDPLFEGSRQAMAIRPDAATYIFEGDHPIHEVDEAASFVRPVLGFLA